jgi:hypothetical protein
MASVERCEACKFWNETGGSDSGLVGECHRNAPSPILCEKPVDSNFRYALWPVTADQQWCGDFEKRPMATRELMERMAMIEKMESKRKKKNTG